MNHTIDFKTAKTIDSMSKKIDHIDDAVTGFFSVMHMAMNATTAMATMYQAGAMALPVASMRAMEMNDAEPPKMALAKLKDSAKPE